VTFTQPLLIAVALNVIQEYLPTTAAKCVAVATPPKHSAAAVGRATSAAARHSCVRISPAIVAHSSPLAVVFEFNTAAARHFTISTAVGQPSSGVRRAPTTTIAAGAAAGAATALAADAHVLVVDAVV